VGRDKGNAGLVGGLGEHLLLDREPTKVHVVVRKKARERARAVLDGKVRAVRLHARRLSLCFQCMFF
jgi:hypothetical protein